MKICFWIKGDEYEEQLQFKDCEFSQTKTKEWSLIANSSKAKTRQMTSVRLFKILFTIYDRKTNKRKTTKRPNLIQNSGSNLLCNPEVDFTSDKSFAATFLPQPTSQYTLLSFAEK